MVKSSAAQTSPGVQPDSAERVRLQKIIAAAGLASRREAERWIVGGHVTVNGSVIAELGGTANPATDDIRVDGRPVRAPLARAYYALNKPVGVVTTMKDDRGRPSVRDFLVRQQRRQGIFPIGRLDYASSGLLLLTNDGELAYRLAHPRFEVRKSYRVRLSGLPTEGQLEHLRCGVRLSDGLTSPAEVRVLRKLKQKAWLEVVMHEGRHREIRRMMEAVGHTVERLERVRIGPIELDGLPPGTMRRLSKQEVQALRRLVGLRDAPNRVRARSWRPKAEPTSRERDRRQARSRRVR